MLRHRSPTRLPAMIFCPIVLSALAACGGGGGGGAATAVATAATPVASSTADAATASASGSSADVLAGTGSTGDIAAAVTVAGETSSAMALGVRATVAQLPLATQDQTFLVVGTMSVRYGAGTAWVTKDVNTFGTCNAAFFGTDPAPGVTKSCQVAVTATGGSGSAPPAVGFPAAEGAGFFVFGTGTVQFGVNGKLVSKSVTGQGVCSAAFFGSDPAPGIVKTCQATLAGAAAPTMTAPAAAGSLMPAVDLARLPTPVAGYATPRVMAANVADPSQVPAGSDIGDFREYCEFSHMSFDDPIAAPGGKSAHLHTFLGNTGVDANSTATSIANTGNSTCAGGTLNRTAYWVPTVIDTTDGTPQVPLGSLIYYKQNYNYVTAASIRPFPAGLRMVAGNAASSGVQDGIAGFTCYKPDGSSTTSKAIPTDCQPGSTLTIGVGFPQCWDGVNLDSPDHKSHMAYPVFGCPATHPVPLTGITFLINYKVGANGTARWRLSSDNYDRSLPGGYSSHADWFNGWNTDIMNVWTTRCINASMDCHAFLIGDGRILF